MSRQPALLPKGRVHLHSLPTRYCPLLFRSPLPPKNSRLAARGVERPAPQLAPTESDQTVSYSKRRDTYSTQISSSTR